MLWHISVSSPAVYVSITDHWSCVQVLLSRWWQQPALEWDRESFMSTGEFWSFIFNHLGSEQLKLTCQKHLTIDTHQDWCGRSLWPSSFSLCSQFQWVNGWNNVSTWSCWRSNLSVFSGGVITQRTGPASRSTVFSAGYSSSRWVQCCSLIGFWSHLHVSVEKIQIWRIVLMLSMMGKMKAVENDIRWFIRWLTRWSLLFKAV